MHLGAVSGRPSTIADCPNKRTDSRATSSQGRSRNNRDFHKKDNKEADNKVERQRGQETDQSSTQTTKGYSWKGSNYKGKNFDPNYRGRGRGQPTSNRGGYRTGERLPLSTIETRRHPAEAGRFQKGDEERHRIPHRRDATPRQESKERKLEGGSLSASALALPDCTRLTCSKCQVKLVSKGALRQHLCTKHGILPNNWSSTLERMRVRDTTIIDQCRAIRLQNTQHQANASFTHCARDTRYTAPPSEEHDSWRRLVMLERTQDWFAASDWDYTEINQEYERESRMLALSIDEVSTQRHNSKLTDTLTGWCLSIQPDSRPILTIPTEWRSEQLTPTAVTALIDTGCSTSAVTTRLARSVYSSSGNSSLPVRPEETNGTHFSNRRKTDRYFGGLAGLHDKSCRNQSHILCV